MLAQIAQQQPHLVHYVPLATTLLSAAFCVVLLRRYAQRRSGAHLLWWAGGIYCYGVGTATESLVTLLGNSPGLNRAWYVAGALLGGYPLAQGTVYLLLRRRTAHVLSAVTVPFILLFSVFVFLSPVNLSLLESQRPGGAALEWQWIRWFTPIINLYAVLFLVGGAFLSAVRYAQERSTLHRAMGNGLIAFGAILPGFGGGMAKAGHVEVLYLGEFFGLILIWCGYACCVRTPLVRAAAAAIESVSAGPRLAAEAAYAQNSAPAESHRQRSFHSVGGPQAVPVPENAAEP